jgi:thioredoxin-dependent peroxiredoxin
MPEEGQKAPDFNLRDQKGVSHSIEKYRGKKVVLYFYPKDDTPGCTIEACNFRDQHNLFEGVNAVILGVSPDSEKSHEKFAGKFNLQFPLLADTEKEVCQNYGVLKEKSMFGKKYMGVERTTFLINEEGIIEKVFKKVKVEGHNDELLKAIKG